MKDYIVFDTETTGLIKSHLIPLDRQPRVIEYAGIRMNAKGKEIDRLEFTVDPGIPIPEEITKITGIKTEDVKGKKKFAHYSGKLASFHKGVFGCIAHNLSFDIDIVSFELKRMNYAWVWPERKICTVEETVHILGRRMRLAELHQYLFDKGFDGAHRAMVDVEALKACVVELVKRKVIEL